MQKGRRQNTNADAEKLTTGRLKSLQLSLAPPDETCSLSKLLSFRILTEILRLFLRFLHANQRKRFLVTGFQCVLSANTCVCHILSYCVQTSRHSAGQFLSFAQQVILVGDEDMPILLSARQISVSKFRTDSICGLSRSWYHNVLDQDFQPCQTRWQMRQAKVLRQATVFNITLKTCLSWKSTKMFPGPTEISQSESKHRNLEVWSSSLHQWNTELHSRPTVVRLTRRKKRTCPELSGAIVRLACNSKIIKKYHSHLWETHAQRRITHTNHVPARTALNASNEYLLTSRWYWASAPPHTSPLEHLIRLCQLQTPQHIRDFLRYSTSELVTNIVRIFVP